MKRHLLTLSLIALLSACKPAATPAPPEAAATKTEAPAETPATTAVGTTPTPAGAIPFSVEVSLSEKARARLASPAETIVISASYFADPTPAASNQANDVGQIDMGRVQAEIPAAGTATFDGSALQQDKLGLIQSEPQVNINVYSGRKSSPDNLLDCGIFQDSVAVAAKAPIRIDCKLISEAP